MDKGLLDIGLLLEPVDMEKYDFVRLDMKERWVVLMPPGDPLAEKESVTAKDLSELSLILPRRLQVQSELASWFGIPNLWPQAFWHGSGDSPLVWRCQNFRIFKILFEQFPECIG